MDMALHTRNPSIWEAEAGGSLLGNIEYPISKNQNSKKNSQATLTPIF
jgi:hypothetical protein